MVWAWQDNCTLSTGAGSGAAFLRSLREGRGGASHSVPNPGLDMRPQVGAQSDC